MPALRLGAALSQTGLYALQGRQALQGLRLWVEDTNARGGLSVPGVKRAVRLDLLAYDDRSRRAEVERLTAQLIRRDRVDILVGPYSSGLTRAAAAIAEAHGKLLWNHGGSSDAIMQQGWRWLVNLPTPASRYFAGLFAALAGWLRPGERLAIVQRQGSPFAAEVAAGTRQLAERGGLCPLPAWSYPTAPEQLAALLQEVAAAAPALLVGVGRYADDVALVRALAERRLALKAVAVVAAPMQAFYQDLQAAAEGCIGPSQWEPEGAARPDCGPSSAEFVARYRQRYGELPDYPAAQAYAAGVLIARCIAQAGTCDDAELRRAARQLVCRTFYGDFRLDPETGVQIGHETVLVQWQAGRKRIIWPATAAQAAPLVPWPLGRR
jgi:branched-chain amino acid transport system substrate-binding protein